MRTSIRSSVIRWWLPLLAVAGVAGPLCARAEDVPQQAVWAEKTIIFHYTGFTAKYSCDGLRDKVRDFIRQFGASKDATVYEYGCSTTQGRPDPFPSVRIKMKVLQPEGAADTGKPPPHVKHSGAKPAAPSAPVPAEWKTVQLRLDGSAINESGQCELVEQLSHAVLPLFTTRNVELSSNCIPHQASAGSPRLQADVLVPVAGETAKR
ncbi:MAG TPA: hypothetical protein VJQ47_15255 [Steroidobacteraceae bacterium]|nr:hypothetical protein [Steroidobacteraceae bacterium]